MPTKTVAQKPADPAVTDNATVNTIPGPITDGMPIANTADDDMAFTVGEPVAVAVPPRPLAANVVAFVDDAREQPTLWFPVQVNPDTESRVRTEIRRAAKVKGYSVRFRPGRIDKSGRFKVKVTEKVVRGSATPVADATSQTD